jgi:hypothetical protein
LDYKSLAKKCQLQLKISEAKLALAVASIQYISRRAGAGFSLPKELH